MELKKCEKKENCIAEIIIGIDQEEIQTATNKVYNKNKSRISVPGFRKGKAPRRIIEKMYGEKIFLTEALEMLFPDVHTCAVEQSKLKFYGQPEIKDINFETDNGGVDVQIEVQFYPEVTIGEYKGLSAVRPGIEVLDSEIDNEIDGVRNRNARIEKVDRPVIDGDIVIIDFAGFVDGVQFDGGTSKNYELTIGSNRLIPGFEQGLIGMSPGEKRDLELVFPDGYSESLSGKPVVFEVILNEVKEKILPDLDDEFVKDVSEFDTLDEYRADIAEKLQNTKKTEASDAFENALLDKIIDSMEVDLPTFLVEKQMDKAVKGFERQVAAYGMNPVDYLKNMNVTPEVFRESTRTDSEQQVKTMLALEKIAELEDLEASSEDIELEYKKAAENFGMEIDKLKESVAKEGVIADIKKRLALELVLENAIEETA